MVPAAEDRALFGRIFTVYAERRFDVWAVRREGRLVGHAEVKYTEVAGGHEIIYALVREEWGAGLGSEVAHAVVAYAFDTLLLPEVHATVAAPNEASIRVLRRLGFSHVRDVDGDDHTTRVFTQRRGEER